MYSHFFHNSKWMSVQMLCSYLAVLVAPLAAVVVFYVQTSSALVDVQYEKSYRMQKEAVTSFEQQINEVSNVAGYLMKEPAVLKLMEPCEDRVKEFWLKYQFVQNRPDYSLTNRMIRNIYILAESSNYIIRMPVVVPAEQIGYRSVTDFSVSTYEELKEELFKNSSYGNINLIDGKEMEKEMVLTYSKDEKGSVSGVIAAVLEQKQVRDVLGNSNPYEESLTCILDTDANIVCTIMGSKCELDPKVLAQECASSIQDRAQWDGYEVMKIKHEKYQVCVRTGGTQGWSYVTATPVNVLTRQIHGMRLWLIVLSVLACLISILICTWYWSRRRSLIRKCVDFQEKMEEYGVEQRNKKSGFWDSVGTAFEHIDKLQQTVTWQEELARDSVIRNLLYGNYTTEEELRPELERVHMDFPKKEYYVAVWAFDDISDSGMFGDSSQFRAYIQHFLEENGLTEENYFYELNYNTLAVLIKNPNVKSLADVKNYFLERNSQLREQIHIACYTGISEPVGKLNEISNAFELAKSACEYARYYRMAAPMDKSEIPELTSTLFFSAEQEKMFFETIREGSEEQLSQALGQIRKTIDAQKPSIPIAIHYMNFVKSAVIRAVSDYSTEPDMLGQIAKISETDDWHELFEQVVEAKKIIKAAQSEAANRILEQKKDELMEQIYNHYSEADFNLAVLANNYKVSESKMYRDFRLYFGKSFAEVLESVRISKARKLLENGCPVKEVTMLTGYSSDVSFRRAFKRVVGVTPTEFTSK